MIEPSQSSASGAETTPVAVPAQPPHPYRWWVLSLLRSLGGPGMQLEARLRQAALQRVLVGGARYAEKAARKGRLGFLALDDLVLWSLATGWPDELLAPFGLTSDELHLAISNRFEKHAGDETWAGEIPSALGVRTTSVSRVARAARLVFHGLHLRNQRLLDEPTVVMLLCLRDPGPCVARELLAERGVSFVSLARAFSNGNVPRPVPFVAVDGDPLSLVLHNDAFTPADFVVEWLQRTLGLTPAESIDLTGRIHRFGSAGVLTAPRAQVVELLEALEALARSKGLPLYASAQLPDGAPGTRPASSNRE